MKRFIIEREIPGASELTQAQLAEIKAAPQAEKIAVAEQAVKQAENSCGSTRFMRVRSQSAQGTPQ